MSRTYGDDANDESLEDCLHCGGSGEEPFTDGDECELCLGMERIPHEMNEEYHEIVTEAMEDG